MKIVDAMTETWRQAALDLGFDFTAPFSLYDGKTKIQCFGHLPQFGSDKGMVVFVELNDAHWKIAAAQGYGYSCLTANGEPYDREIFIDILNDWGWLPRNGTPPDWYTGAPWTT